MPSVSPMAEGVARIIDQPKEAIHVVVGKRERVVIAVFAEPVRRRVDESAKQLAPVAFRADTRGVEHQKLAEFVDGILTDGAFFERLQKLARVAVFLFVALHGLGDKIFVGVKMQRRPRVVVPHRVVIPDGRKVRAAFFGPDRPRGHDREQSREQQDDENETEESGTMFEDMSVWGFHVLPPVFFPCNRTV